MLISGKSISSACPRAAASSWERKCAHGGFSVEYSGGRGDFENIECNFGFHSIEIDSTHPSTDQQVQIHANSVVRDANTSSHPHRSINIFSNDTFLKTSGPYTSIAYLSSDSGTLHRRHFQLAFSAVWTFSLSLLSCLGASGVSPHLTVQATRDKRKGCTRREGRTGQDSTRQGRARHRIGRQHFPKLNLSSATVAVLVAQTDLCMVTDVFLPASVRRGADRRCR